MFQIGDKVVSIIPYKNKNISFLEKNKIYIVIDTNYGIICNEIKVNNPEGYFFDVKRFKLLTEIRKEKIKILKNKIKCQYLEKK
jgi:hypothetical protein